MFVILRQLGPFLASPQASLLFGDFGSPVSWVGAVAVNRGAAIVNRARSYLSLGLLILVVGCSSEPPAPDKADSILRGDSLMAEKKYVQAATSYRRAVLTDPRDGSARLKLAQAYAAAANWPAASKEALQSADLMPENVEAQLLAGQILLGQGWFTDAASRARLALRQDPQNVDALVTLANATAKITSSALGLTPETKQIQGDFQRAFSGLRPLVPASEDEKAEGIFRQAVQLAPTNANAQIALANFLSISGRIDEVEEPLRRAATEPDNWFPYRVLGSFYLSHHRNAEAETYLKVAAEAGDSVSRFALADLYLKLERYDEASSILSKMEASDDSTGRVSVLRATADFHSGRRAQALSLLDQLLERQPQNLPALLLKAQFLTVEGQWEPAMRVAQAALAQGPESSEAHEILGKILMATGNPDGAFSELSEAMRLSPAAAGLSLKLAQASVALGKSDEALQFARQAKRQHPENPESSLVLAKVLMLKGDYASADEELKPLLTRDPSADVLVQAAKIQIAMKNRGDARALFTRALQSNPDLLEATSGLVVLDLQDGQHAAARSRAERAVGAHPNQVASLLLAADVYEAQRDTAATEKVLRLANSAEPGNIVAAQRLSELLAKSGRGQEAGQALERVVTAHPESVEARTALARLLEDTGKRDEARAHYEKVVAENPSAVVASIRLANLYAEGGGNLDVALRLASRARQGAPKDAAASATLGRIYILKNFPELGRPHLEDAVRLAPRDGSARYHLGAAYLRLGNLAKARVEFEQSLAVEPNGQFAPKARETLRSMARRAGRDPR